MPSKKKDKLPHDMTTEELAKKVFPPAVLDQLKQILQEADQPKSQKSSHKEST